ncbi:hypothetical protein M427DRAFT_30524 [Gonapodya prolifera JEL478]|uniref:Uncharacterized protein n=1 Tax=Gonapodya prolifera (strain JEL478) TaxID=1344416 RepID=A0A139ALS1_GONPJ|nr:hypothetical protein M427DRAFT_30524 [Gonapodya prolifera JEL478]|eukprot:KXS17395.1 hypothetical protein M427DRAFT_30524 [Gonapodya prolifera JEL478]
MASHRSIPKYDAQAADDMDIVLEQVVQVQTIFRDGWACWDSATGKFGTALLSPLLEQRGRGDIERTRLSPEVNQRLPLSGGWGTGCTSAREIERAEGTRPACGDESKGERASANERARRAVTPSNLDGNERETGRCDTRGKSATNPMPPVWCG